MVRRHAVVAIAAFIFLGLPLNLAWGQTPDATPDFLQLLQRMAGESPESCTAPGRWKQDPSGLEQAAFEQAANSVTKALNVPLGDGNHAKNRAIAALRELEQQSARLNTAWPVENRFHFEMLNFDLTARMLDLWSRSAEIGGWWFRSIDRQPEAIP